MDRMYSEYNSCGQLVLPNGVAHDDVFACGCFNLLVIGEVCEVCGFNYEISQEESTTIAKCYTEPPLVDR